MAMAMAAAAVAAFFGLFLVLVRADDVVENQLLDGINSYRSQIGVPPLAPNRGASCLADKLADRFEDKPCDNMTLAQTSPGLEPNFKEYPQMLQDCKLVLQNTTAGRILVDCIPNALSSAAAQTASQNFTRSQEYQQYINSTDYTSAGIGHEDLWFVLVLGTQNRDGNFAQQQTSDAGILPQAQRFLVAAAVAVAGFAAAI